MKAYYHIQVYNYVKNTNIFSTNTKIKYSLTVEDSFYLYRSLFNYIFFKITIKINVTAKYKIIFLNSVPLYDILYYLIHQCVEIHYTNLSSIYIVFKYL